MCVQNSFQNNAQRYGQSLYVSSMAITFRFPKGQHKFLRKNNCGKEEKDGE